MTMVNILLQFEDWSVCESDERSDGNVEVYAEHDTCSADKDKDTSASWSWEYRDQVGLLGYEVCWECEERVPENVIALVRLHNWGR